MAALPRCDELRRAANSLEWEAQFILYCHRAISEDSRVAREINDLCACVTAIIEERESFVDELDVLTGRHVPEKMAEFMRETLGKDTPNLMKLQILGCAVAAAVAGGVPAFVTNTFQSRRTRALEQETRDLDLENKQVKIFKASYGETTPQELRRNPIKARSLGKEIEGLEALDFADFVTMHEGQALQNLDQFYHVSYRHEDRTFTSQAWNRLFRIQEPVIRVYVLEFLSSFKFRDHVIELDIVDTIVFQLEEVKRSMNMRQFTLALGLYTKQEMNNNLFEFFRDACRHNAKEKVTLEYLFFLHSMDGGALVDVPWNIIKFLFDKAKRAKKKSMIVGAHLIGRFARYNRLGQGELVDDMLDNSKDEVVAAEARRA
ncbi:hypothetical protein Tco_0749473 [Tanacetum coccineum]|uniref:Uncharacterized protein n=1 Tax=Tanacetum coccineum TaxID=301880 RepID=A0ABQ4Z1K5_9ASTR